MTESPLPGLAEAVQALRTWIESRQFKGYEPFDLPNSPYLTGSRARKADPGIILIQGGKRFAGQRLRQLLMRWGQAWTFRALARLLAASSSFVTPVGL